MRPLLLAMAVMLVMAGSAAAQANDPAYQRRGCESVLLSRVYDNLHSHVTQLTKPKMIDGKCTGSGIFADGSDASIVIVFNHGEITVRARPVSASVPSAGAWYAINMTTLTCERSSFTPQQLHDEWASHAGVKMEPITSFDVSKDNGKVGVLIRGTDDDEKIFAWLYSSEEECEGAAASVKTRGGSHPVGGIPYAAGPTDAEIAIAAATRATIDDLAKTDMTVDTYKANEPDLLGRIVTVSGIAGCSIGVDICTMYSPANPLGYSFDFSASRLSPAVQWALQRADQGDTRLFHAMPLNPVAITITFQVVNGQEPVAMSGQLN